MINPNRNAECLSGVHLSLCPSEFVLEAGTKVEAANDLYLAGSLNNITAQLSWHYEGRTQML